MDLCSSLYFDLLYIMGWDVGFYGLWLWFFLDLMNLIEWYLVNDVIMFFDVYWLIKDDIGVWVSYFGGFKVIDVVVMSFVLFFEVFELIWCLLGEIGNFLLVLILYILCDIIEKWLFSGSVGLMLVMGFGFCMEFVLLCWC